MEAPIDVVVIVGSLRKDSINRKVARALIALAPPALNLEIAEIGDLLLYNQDSDGTELPPPWSDFRNRIKRAQAVLFVTPEYNRSIPSPLKNAIDVGSRPYGHNVWDRKPAAVVSVSPGAIGGFGANHHVRQTMVFLNMPVMQQPEAYLGGADKYFDQAGKFAHKETEKFLRTVLESFETWIKTNIRQ